MEVIFTKKIATELPLELIKIASHEQLTIVTSNFLRIKEIKAAAEEMGLKIPMPISYYEFNSKMYPAKFKPKGFLIDNINIYLQKYADAPIIAVAISK